MINDIRATTPTLAVALLLSALWAAPAAAQSGPPMPDGARTEGTEATNTLIRNRVLQRTAFVSGSGGQAPAGTFYPIHDPISIGCPTNSTGSCVIEVDQNVQVRTGAESAQWAICTQVDGVYMSQPLCPYLATLPPSSGYVVGNFMQTRTGVRRGTRVVQTFVYSTGALEIANWSLAYRVYKPL